jgi:hypothetical protein
VLSSECDKKRTFKEEHEQNGIEETQQILWKRNEFI